MSNSAITGPVFSDVRRSPSGSAAAPSWSFAESTGTGVYLVSAGVLGLSTNGAQRVVVDADGRVGVGITPRAKFHLNQTDSILLDARSPTAIISDGFNDGSGGLTIGSFKPIIQMIDYSGSAGHFTQEVEGTSYIIKGGSTADTSYAGLTERMRIDASGNLLVGTTSGSAHRVKVSAQLNGGPGGLLVDFSTRATSEANTEALRVTGTSNIGQVFKVLANGVIYSTNTSVQPIASDVSLKKDIIDYDKGLAAVLKMKPRYFSWKTEPDRKDIGFIAQEMDEALPGSMVDNGEGAKTYQVNWHPLLVKAIQELKAELDEAKAKIAALEAK